MRIPDTFDGVFDLYRGAIPLAYLRALAWSESGLDPSATPPHGSAIGLFQILRAALDDFERRNGYPGMDLRNPADNTAVAVHLLGMIIAAYAARGLKANWNDPNFVGLLTLGYKAGWSSSQGVSYLIQRIPRPWTVEKVIAAAQSHFPDSRLWSRQDSSRPAGHAGYMSDPSLRRAVADVVRDYLGDDSADRSAGSVSVEVGMPIIERRVPAEPQESRGGLLFAALAALGLGGLIAKRWKK